MNWAQFILTWKQLMEKIAFRRESESPMIGRIAETLKRAQRRDDQAAPFRPDHREKRHEFSQHIGC